MNLIPNINKLNFMSWLRRRSPVCGVIGRSTRNTRVSPAAQSAGFSTLFLAAVACATIVMPASSRASLMAYEGFNYTSGSGNLTAKNGGFGWSSQWYTINNGSSSVQAGSLAAGANAPTGYDSLSTGNAAFTPNGTRTGRWLDRSVGGSFGSKGYINGNGDIGADGKTIYISFMQQPNGTAVYYEFELHRGDLGDPGRMAGVGNDAGDANVHFRIEDPAGGSSTFYDVGAGNTSVNFYVVRIDFDYGGGNSTVTIYRNPTSATEPVTPTQQITGITADMSFDGISLGAFANGITVAHDEVRLGEAWADVVSPGTYSTGAWAGGGAGGNWSTGANWDNDVVPVFATSLTFAGMTGLDNTNDLTGVSANNITFDSAAGAFSMNGNSLGLNGNISFNASPASPITQTIYLPLATTRDITVATRTNGSITLNGDITGGNQLTQSGPDNAGVLTMAGTNALKGLVVNNGTNVITGATTVNGIGGSSFFYVPDAGSGRNATLIIENGATLTITNGFQDSAVIARDGSRGKIIQNGGTFNFAINDGSHNNLYVGASGQPNGYAEYDMNGGMLDMHGDTLGIALGVNAGNVTGVVNQVNGVITNVAQLLFSPSFTHGYGIYNLTGGSIFIDAGGITNFPGSSYEINLGGGTIGAVASWTCTLDMNLTGNNGPVTFNPNGNVISLSGALYGSGGIAVDGAGILTLSGANTFTGDINVTAGSTLEFDSTGSSVGALKLENGSTLNLNFSGDYAVGSFYTNGVALPVGTYNSGNLPGFITGFGNLQVASGISSGLWMGGGADDNWSTGGNWDNNAVPVFPHSVMFAGSTRLTNNNDLSGITVSSLTFDSAAGPFELNGNDITSSGSIGFNGNPAAPITQTVNLNMTWNTDKTIDTPTNGNLTLGGNISASANKLTKNGAGTLALGGYDSFASHSVNGGTNIITGNTTVSGTGDSRVYVADGDAISGCSGTLLIENGATYTFTGTFADYMVIGRDSGSGKVVQNGGTFTFNPSDSHGILLVAAGGAAHGYGEYDINGGVLDLGGFTLGAGWGDGGAVTGVVNQAGGTIDNVFNLDLGVVRANGIGIYNLSGGTINIDFGGITSDSGLYQINLGGGTVGAIFDWASSLNMNLTNVNGSVKFDPNGNTITLSGTLSGNGGLIVTNFGTLKIAGPSSFTGDTIVSAGTTLEFDLTGTSSSILRMVDGAMLNSNYSGTRVVPAFYTNGVALADGVYNSGNLPGFIMGSGDLQVASAISTGLWGGGGADNYWSTAGNWDNNAVPVFPIDLTFAGSTRLANTNDLSAVTASSITFDAAAGAFVLNGNDITLNGNIGFNGNPAAPVTQTVNFNLAWSANKTIDVPANGTLSLGGDITTSVNDLTKTGAGTLTLGGVDSFAGYANNGGTNVITGDVTANGTGGSRFVLANANNTYNGTLIIQPGATFTVIGDWTDAGVIGRDGGQATVTQNGGTFNFNMSNQPWLFVGAAGFPDTVATYNMNGGLLDMNGKNLGLALAVNNVTVTGVVNQAGGVITNVGHLYLGVVGGQQGNGIYNLTGGSLYIGANGITSDSGIYQMNLGGGTIVAQASWTSTLSMTLTGNNGPVTFDPATNTITLSGMLSGSGGLDKVGSGTLQLSGANAYTGDTTVNAGTLKLNVAGTRSSVLRIVDGAILNLNYGGTITVPACYTNGVPLASGVYTSANLPGFITGTGSLTIPSPAAPVVNSPVVSGGNLILMGSGGTVGGSYVWLTSTNVATPMALWTTNATGNFDGSGNFSNAIPVNASMPAGFFRLRTP